MSNILIAESGATKTDWRLLDATKKIKAFSTTGINPYLQTPEMILAVLENELGWDTKKHQADKVFYYGTGVSNVEQQKKIGKVLTHFFKTKSVTVNHDMLAAARAACGNNKGVVSILGTGSNSCYFDGKQIKVQQRSLGYIAGDEGSGNYLVSEYYSIMPIIPLMKNLPCLLKSYSGMTLMLSSKSYMRKHFLTVI